MLVCPWSTLFQCNLMKWRSSDFGEYGRYKLHVAKQKIQSLPTSEELRYISGRMPAGKRSDLFLKDVLNWKVVVLVINSGTLTKGVACSTHSVFHNESFVHPKVFKAWFWWNYQGHQQLFKIEQTFIGCTRKSLCCVVLCVATLYVHSTQIWEIL